MVDISWYIYCKPDISIYPTYNWGAQPCIIFHHPYPWRGPQSRRALITAVSAARAEGKAPESVATGDVTLPVEELVITGFLHDEITGH